MTQAPATTPPAASPTDLPTASPTAEPTEPPTEQPDAEPAPAGDYTAPGTELTFDEKALVPFVSQDAPGTLGVTVTGIRKGTEQELEQLGLGQQVSGMTPYYIDFTVTNESGTDFSFSSLGPAGGLLDDGSRAQSVSVIGDFEPCPNEPAGADFNTVGASYSTCKLALAGGSAEVTAGYYNGFGYYGETIPDAPDYSNDPIVWKP